MLEGGEPGPVLDRGGSVAVVTDRKPTAPITQWSTVPVVDADLTDEWIFRSGVIGDLSAKGKARKLIGRSGFVHSHYGAPKAQGKRIPVTAVA